MAVTLIVGEGKTLSGDNIRTGTSTFAGGLTIFMLASARGGTTPTFSNPLINGVTGTEFMDFGVDGGSAIGLGGFYWTEAQIPSGGVYAWSWDVTITNDTHTTIFEADSINQTTPAINLSQFTSTNVLDNTNVTATLTSSANLHGVFGLASSDGASFTQQFTEVTATAKHDLVLLRGDNTRGAFSAWLDNVVATSPIDYIMNMKTSEPITNMDSVVWFAFAMNKNAGSTVRTGVGLLTAQAAVIDGTGIRTSVIKGDQGITAGAAIIAGTGRRGRSGHGVLTAQPAIISGTGIAGKLASGALSAQAAVIDGTGIRTSVIKGDAGITAQAAQIAGTGQRGTTIKGDQGITAQAAVISGTGSIEGSVLGSGALSAQAAVIAGTAKRVVVIKGDAGITAQAATISATGKRVVVITGDQGITAQAAQIDGSDNVVTFPAWRPKQTISASAAPYWRPRFKP